MANIAYYIFTMQPKRQPCNVISILQVRNHDILYQVIFNNILEILILLLCMFIILLILNSMHLVMQGAFSWRETEWQVLPNPGRWRHQSSILLTLIRFFNFSA